MAEGNYNAEMIGDFLAHLLWELRTCAFEERHPGGKNPELEEQLSKFIRKYSTVGLMRPIQIVQGDLSDEEYERYLPKLLAMKRKKTQKQIEALELLRPVFTEAFECATMYADQLVARKLTWSDAAMLYKDESEHPPKQD